MSKFFLHVSKEQGAGVFSNFSCPLVLPCPFCLTHAPTFGCSVLPLSIFLSDACSHTWVLPPPPHTLFHLSLSSINPTLGISLFVRLTLFYSSSPSPSLPCHSVLLVSSFVWHLFVLSFGSWLGWFIPTGTFLSMFSTLGGWFLTCINPFIISISNTF